VGDHDYVVPLEGLYHFDAGPAPGGRHHDVLYPEFLCALLRRLESFVGVLLADLVEVQDGFFLSHAISQDLNSSGLN
jgi:hypothetical protein